MPDPGVAFDLWQGDVDSTERLLVIEMQADTAVQAVFDPGDYDLVVEHIGACAGATNPAPDCTNTLPFWIRAERIAMQESWVPS
mgnify:CR=1 FL=1